MGGRLLVRKIQTIPLIERKLMRNQRIQDMANYQRTRTWVDKFSRPHPQSGKCSSSGSSCSGGFEPKSLPAENLRNCEDSGINWRGLSESRFVKTKLKALKIYKSVKQPISPSGKVAAFLNSLFALKKQKFSRSWHTATTTSTTPSSAKPSIRFFPASGEDCRRLRTGNSGDLDSILDAIDEELAMHMKNKDQLLGCQFEHSFDIFSDEKHDEFDGASCASSDLFELENLSAIGMEELPLYQTTHLHKIMQMD